MFGTTSHKRVEWKVVWRDATIDDRAGRAYRNRFFRRLSQIFNVVVTH
jgi:hypothetical protein